MMIFCTIKSKPLALPWGRTPRLDSGVRVEGCLHIEKTADKWGKNGKGDEWQEKWFEHYGAGQAEKWAHKWCSTDLTTQLETGHAHVWHESQAFTGGCLHDTRAQVCSYLTP
ncbi:hypothetical protein Tco_0231142 [Tanacetum coccineum]